jgi:hypothetical protein
VGADPSAAPDLELTPPNSTPGIIAILGDLGPGTVINEEALATLFQRSPSSVKRAVDKGELPEPVRLFAQPTWTVRVLVDHLEKRLRKAAQRREERELSLARENGYEEAILQCHAP